MDFEELLKIIGEKELEIHILKKHISNLEVQINGLRIELASSPQVELVQVPKGVDPNISKKKK